MADKEPKAITVKSARSRRITAAKRSAKLVRDVIDQHLGLLESQPPQVPEADFVTSAVKYAQALGELRLLDMIAGGGTDSEPEESGNGAAGFAREDVEMLVQLARAFVPAPALTAGAEPILARLEAASAPPAEAAPEQAGDA
jgi:hypothetical protein